MSHADPRKYLPLGWFTPDGADERTRHLGGEALAWFRDRASMEPMFERKLRLSLIERWLAAETHPDMRDYLRDKIELLRSGAGLSA
jgi:hypothetical protein